METQNAIPLTLAAERPRYIYNQRVKGLYLMNCEVLIKEIVEEDIDIPQ